MCEHPPGIPYGSTSHAWLLTTTNRNSTLEILQRQDNYVYQYVELFYSIRRRILAKTTTTKTKKHTHPNTKLFSTRINEKECKVHRKEIGICKNPPLTTFKK